MLRKTKTVTKTTSPNLFHFPAGKLALSKYKNWIHTREIQYTAIKPLISKASLEPLVRSRNANTEINPKHKLITKI